MSETPASEPGQERLNRIRLSRKPNPKLIKEMKKLQLIYSIGMVLLGALLTGTAQADGGGKFTVVNNEEIPIKISLHRTNHCFQVSPGLFENKVLQPGESAEWGWWHPGDYRGCASRAAEFFVVFDPPVGEKNRIGFWGDRGAGFGWMVPEKERFPGELKLENGNERTFTTKAGFKSKDTLISANETIIFDFTDGEQINKTGQTNRTEESETRDTREKAALMARASASYEGAGAKAEGEVQADYEKEIKLAKSKSTGSTGSQSKEWKLSSSQMRIGTVTGNIMKAEDGKVFVKFHKPFELSYNVLPHNENSYSSLVDKYCLPSGIDLLPGLKLESPWGGNSTLRKVVRSSNSSARPGGMNMSKSAGFSGIPANVQAACENGKGTAYFFQGANYWRYYPNTGKVEGPIAISSGWAGLPDNLDAAVNGTNGKLYFFQNGSYWRWDIESDTLDEGHPKAISAGWAGLPDRLDGAMRVPGTKNLVFFAGDKVWSWDMSTDTLGSNARSAASDFPGFPQPIDACSTLGKSTSSFFQGGSVWTK